MSKAAEASWRERVDGWVASGQTCKEYAARIRVNPHTLSWWKWRLESRRTCAHNRSAGEVGFVEVTEEVRRQVNQRYGLASVASLNAGVVTVVQTFRSDLGLYVHLHCLATHVPSRSAAPTSASCRRGRRHHGHALGPLPSAPEHAHPDSLRHRARHATALGSARRAS